MKNKLTALVGLIIAAILLIYMCVFIVRYDEVVVRTTFNKADAPELDKATGLVARKVDGSPVNPGSVCYEPGLYFKWPWPFQDIKRYPTLLQVLDGQIEEQQTADRKSVIIRMYVTWRIEDPYSFFVSLQSLDKAKDQLRPSMLNLKSVVARYRFDQLVNTDKSKLKLDEMEAEMLKEMQKSQLSAQVSYGIKVENLGITRVVLPQRVTTSVFERMRAERFVLAEKARAEGDAQAAQIRTEAQSTRSTILAFAELRATQLRAEGDQEAAKYYTQFSKDQDFAVFLRQVEALKAILANNTTFVLNSEISPIDLFKNEPGTAKQVKPAPAK